MDSTLWALAWLLVFMAVDVPEGQGSLLHRPLDWYVHHYEPLSYSHREVDHQHHRHKRSQPEEDHRVSIDFLAHGRRFEVLLKRDHSVFHNDLLVQDGHEGDKSRSVRLDHIYEGHLAGDPDDSHCFGSIRDGVFDGQISTPDGVFYVERAQKYFRDNSNDTFHSVIYHESHLKDPFQHSKAAGLRRPGCGISEDVQDWMDSVQNSALPTQAPRPPAGFPVTDIDQDLGPTYKYTAEANTPKKRNKRALQNSSNRKSCSLYIQTDPLFWKHIYEQEKDDAKTEEEILSLIAQHVKAVNRIYSDTTFDGKYKHNGYQFEVQRIKIHNSTQCETKPFDSKHNQFCIPNIDVSNFLNLHSKSNHEVFCLSYVFTYRDFTGGTLGLAWVASATGASGGICETYKSYKENINGARNTTQRSLNTGIITFVNYNSRVPPKVSQLTLAHEIGHNFGSPHDYPKQCRPGGELGNYIMFASATSGDRYNNNKFSNCSKHNVSRVLDAILDDLKPNCFKENEGAFCGNKIVEAGEECDCGYDEHECSEQCCYPRQSSNLTESDNKRQRCRRKERVQCSPSEGPCCDRSCNFLSEYDNVQCKSEDDCTAAALCNGLQAECPKPKFKPDNVTQCNEGTQVCQMGECKDSICIKYGLVSCFLTSDLVRDKRELCELACKRPGGNGSCMSTTDLAMSGLVPDLTEGLSLRPGSPCDNFQGYCDVFLKCRQVDAEGPLARLKNLLFNQETLLTIAQWVTEFWWGVLLMGIVFVIIMAIFIKCFAIHTPSSNPRLPKNLHFTETLRRPVRSLQNKHYRPANGGHGAPPPYPGRREAAPPQGRDALPQGRDALPGGPGRGYGDGRGHYNRSREQCAPVDVGSCPMQNVQRRGDGRGRSGQQRASRIEMQPMR